MYVATVFVGRKKVDARTFKFGTWAEIGFWLDLYGYNEPEYRLVVKFTN